MIEVREQAIQRVVPEQDSREASSVCLRRARKLVGQVNEGSLVEN